MTQFKMGTCLNEFAARPELTPLFHGVVGTIPRASCLANELPRRQDGLKPHFGSGTPTVNSATVDIAGLAIATEPVAYTTVKTSEGSLKLPIEREHLQYLPSVSTLDFLIHNQGTRLQPEPKRYFSR